MENRNFDEVFKLVVNMTIHLE